MKKYDPNKRRARYEANIEHHREVMRSYDSTHKKPKGHGKAWRDANPEKVKAKHLINNSIRAGKITRPSICEGCGIDKKLDGHHQDYSKPLDVVWLCRPCHMFVHKVYEI